MALNSWAVFCAKVEAAKTRKAPATRIKLLKGCRGRLIIRIDRSANCKLGRHILFRQDPPFIVFAEKQMLCVNH
jgi:hypothetical protein